MLPNAPPVFKSELLQSDYRNVVRSRWIAEQHFRYEAANVVDVIMLSIQNHDPISTAVVLPDEKPGTFRLLMSGKVSEQRAYYDQTRSKRHLVGADVTTSLGADWYGFVGGMLTHRDVKTGGITLTRFVGILPVSRDGDTISGEIGFGLSDAEATRMSSSSSTRRLAYLNMHRARLMALQSGDPQKLGMLYSDQVRAAARDYPGSSHVPMEGRASLNRFYEALFNRLKHPRVEVLMRLAEDWYSFEELLWECTDGDGQRLRFKTADLTTLNDEGKINVQVGYGTDAEIATERR
jgi:hypothetical protein